MSDSSIGWATLSVIPGLAGFGAALSKGVEPQLAAAGLAGGSAFAKAFAPVALAGAVVAVGVATTKMAANFQEATTLLVTGAGESVGAIGMIRQGLLDMAPAVGMGPEALAKAMFLVESAGFHGADGLKVMASAAQGAKVGGVDATLVADGLTTAMVDYHYAADEANTVTSKLVQTVALGKTNMGDLSSSLSNILPFAANLKIGFNDILGAMATMTGQGIDAAKASTMLKFGIMALANETPQGADALAAIGLTTQQVVTDLGEKGLSGTIAEVTEAIGKRFPAGSAEAVAAMSDIFGGTRGLGMALALSGQNADTLAANIASITAAVPEADGAVRGWTLTQEDLNTQMSQVGAFFTSIGIKLGTTLIPWVTKGTEAFRVFAGEFESGTGAGGKFHDILTAINDGAIKPIGAFLTGTAIPAIQAFIQGFKDGTGIGGGFKDFMVLLYNDAVKPIGDFLVNKAIPAIQNFIQGFRDGVGPGGDLKNILKTVMDEGIKPLASFITDTALPALKNIEDWILGSGGTSLGSLKQWIEKNQGALEALAGIITVILLPAFAVAATDAVASAATQGGAWVASKVAAVDSAIVQYGANVSIVTGWVMSAGAAVADGAIIVAIWAMLKWDAIKSAAASVVAHWSDITAWGLRAAIAVAAGIDIVAAWVMGKVEAGVSLAISLGAHIADGAAWVVNAAIATASGIAMAAAWVIGLGPIAWIIAGIAALVAGFVWLYNNVSWFKDGVDVMWAIVVAGVKWLKDQWTTNFDMVKAVLSTAADFITTRFQSVLDFFQAAPGKIGGFFSGIGDTIWSVFKSAFNGIASLWNNTVGKLAFTMPDIPGLAGRGSKIAMPQIPYMAEGGVVSRATLAMIGEGREPEAVLPLSKLDAMLKNAGGGGGQTINVYGVDRPDETAQAIAAAQRVALRAA
jgi:TP901 family phage tail tape measure protein